MPRDRRAYMTFPIDFWQHPKVEPLSDRAFRVFVEMNGYSRMFNLDGRIEVKTADRKWGRKALTELLESHQTRPLVIRNGDVYVLRDYAEHQLTSDYLDRISEVNRANGRKGGRPRKTESVSESVSEPEANGNRTETERKAYLDLEEDKEADVANSDLSAYVTTARAEEADPFATLKRLELEAAIETQRLGIKDAALVRSWFENIIGEQITLGQTLKLADALLAQARNPVENPDGYLRVLCRRSPDEVRRWFHTLNVGAVV